ncbi:TetR family transcriptional regulator [Nocardiopsis sp. Huas11]|uniref:TetR/AcrR family transcriptional regulator n=1 Tax=Nocardiopsis sp. Huas11 TaxID=2183912 RepID=UPI000EB32C66|nr:TetR/AcrR family transcriptional regulator [Nocardiopsis sp. Huas11]RKS09700.1 TetR family transcriptional regulator [Nocardiopsis sp. Huas11]
MAQTRRPAASPRRADAERNTAAIIDAARVAFGRGEAPAMNEIARAAGVGRVTLYAHFSSREELLAAVLDRVFAEAGLALESARPGSGPADAALERVVRTSWASLDGCRRIRGAALALLGPEHLHERHDAVGARVEGLLDRGRAEGVFRSDLPRDWLVTVFFAVLHAAADEVDGGRLEPGRAADHLAASVLALVRTPPPAGAAGEGPTAGV